MEKGLRNRTPVYYRPKRCTGINPTNSTTEVGNHYNIVPSTCLSISPWLGDRGRAALAGDGGVLTATAAVVIGFRWSTSGAYV